MENFGIVTYSGSNLPKVVPMNRSFIENEDSKFAGKKQVKNEARR
jgi:hypothetical protein